jgi:uncharacterized cupin superfamily protein
MGGGWQDLAHAAGSVDVGLKRIRVDEGKVSTPPHVHAREEEIFFVHGGAGLLLQDGATCELRAGDCIVHAGYEVHTLVGGAGGLEVLAFGPRETAEGGYLPRSRNLWVSAWAVRTLDHHPWDDEVELGMPEIPEPGERPPNVVNRDDVEGSFGGLWKRLATEAGAKRTGLSYGILPPGEEGAPPHLHTVEEEIYVVLEGAGILELWPSPARAAAGREREEHPIRAGHVLAFPPGTGMAHFVRTDTGMTYLAYGTRSPADVCFYPRSNKIFFRGAGLIARLEHLDYFDGEP